MLHAQALGSNILGLYGQPVGNCTKLLSCELKYFSKNVLSFEHWPLLSKSIAATDKEIRLTCLHTGACANVIRQSLNF